MTKSLSGAEIARRLREHFPEVIAEADETAVIVEKGALFEVLKFLKETPGFDFDYLVNITGVDYQDYFEVIYQLVSVQHNHSLVVKTKCQDRKNPALPSVVTLWQGADFQEREIYDLLGVKFEGHPDLRRIFLWEGFPGHPLRKDWRKIQPPELISHGVTN